MGSCCGSEANKKEEVRSGPGSVALEKEKGEVQKKNTLTLNEEKKKHTRRNTSTKGMTKLAMKFPYIRKSFKSCKKVFDIKAKQYNTNPPSVLKSDVKALLIQLGTKESNLTEKEMIRIIKTSNLDDDNKIDFKEFLIAAAVGCFLADNALKEINDGTCSEEFASNRKGFEVAREAFDSIDIDKSGEIDYEELKAAFIAMDAGNSNNNDHNELIETRLKELDFDKDGDIGFPEFVWGITQWVMGDQGDDDDEDAVAENTTANAGDLMSPKTAIHMNNYNEDEEDNVISNPED